VYQIEFNNQQNGILCSNEDMTTNILNIANFGSLVLSYLECDLHQKLNICTVVCKVCLLWLLQRSLN